VALQFRKERSFVILNPGEKLREEPCDKQSPPVVTPKAANSRQWRAPTGKEQTGPNALRHPMLLPAVLRQSFDGLAEGLQVHVYIGYPRTVSVPEYIAPTPAKRQRRRKTWKQRLAWNALPAAALVNIDIKGPQTPASQLRVAEKLCGKAA